ncbi:MULTISPECIES: helix-turn-helix domain-containing protein [Nocardia]|uniref:winged helix-turn-helix transcriptional regulator n=1 Tax=Nocardia TaxID=1817 RepID=UPI001915B121|nr:MULTISPECIES: helix-turn-helix domain-containing protein [Nocardia]
MEVSSQVNDEANSSVFRRDCPSRDIFEHLTGRWSLLVLAALRPDSRRFHQLRDRIEGINEKMLSQTLRTLERDGLVERTVLPVKPPQVWYALTGLGEEAARHLCGLISWIGASTPTIRTAQEGWDNSR